MSRYVKIGLFVTITSVVLTLYVMRTAEVVGTGRTYTVHAYVNDASGLLVDSNVKLAGVDVGRLTNIELDGDRARLTLEIRDDVQLYEDAVVGKATESMLGTATVSINPGTARGALLSDGDVVRNVRQTASITDAVGNANNLAANAADLVDQLNRYVQDENTVQAIEEIVAVVRETAVSTSELLEQNLRIARSTMENIQTFSARLDRQSVDQLERVQEILDSTASLTARLDSLVGSNDESLTASIRGIEENLAGLQRVIASLETSAGNVETITGTVREGEGNIGRLVNDDELYDRAVRITEKAESFLDSTVGLGVQVGFDSAYLTQQGASRNAFELRLSPEEAGRFYSVGVVGTPRPREFERTTDTVTTGTGGDAPEDTTTTETIRTTDPRLNLQLARAWGPLTVRAGVFENTAGVAVDVQPLDQLAVSAEAYDFGIDGGAYLRGYGTVYPFYDPASNNPLQWLYLSGGVEDILGTYQRDYFFGAGVRFVDEDLRGLVGFIPIN